MSAPCIASRPNTAAMHESSVAGVCEQGFSSKTTHGEKSTEAPTPANASGSSVLEDKSRGKLHALPDEATVNI